jgi:oligopeptide/dipeptide ABC transporter ATP-binding protein
VVSVRGLTVALPSRDGYRTVLDDVDLDVAPGEVVGLAGESGSGKSMTALAIMRLLPSARPRVVGSIEYAGRDLLRLPRREMQRVRGGDISIVFQEPMTALHPAWTIGEQIAEAARVHRGASRREAAELTTSLLRRVGITDPVRVARSRRHQLSGGMQQRAMIAMALVGKPRLLIADEPTTALDVTIQAQIVELLASLRAELGMAVLFISHDLHLLGEICDRVVVMYAGQVVEAAATDALFDHPRHPYTQALIDCRIDPSRKGRPLPSISGHPPRTFDLLDGCRFAPRCPHTVPACQAAIPPVEPVADHGIVRCIRHRELAAVERSAGADPV